MNYFTPEWHRGYVEEHPGKKYREHLLPLLRQWPTPVRMLANSISLHDGFICKFAWDTQKATLFLRLRCGDLQVGYFDLNLHYFGVLLSPLDWGNLLAISTSRMCSALYDEVDEENGRFVHRILFVSYRRVRRSRRYRASRSVRMSRRGIVAHGATKPRYREVTIRFENLQLAITQRKGRFGAGEV